jgi:hypothetical protein
MFQGAGAMAHRAVKKDPNGRHDVYATCWENGPIKFGRSFEGATRLWDLQKEWPWMRSQYWHGNVASKDIAVLVERAVEIEFAGRFTHRPRSSWIEAPFEEVVNFMRAECNRRDATFIDHGIKNETYAEAAQEVASDAIK